jgi:hypothetical protein
MFHVLASEKPCTSIYLAPLLECRKASRHQPSEVWSFSYWFDNLGFTTEGKLVVVLIIPSSWGSQWGVMYMPSSIFSGTIAGEKEDLCKGSLSRSIFYFVIVLPLFLLASFYQNTKKLVPLIACIPLLLLLVHYVVP